MGEFRKQVGQRVLRTRCDDALASHVEWLLEAVASFDQQGKGLADGVAVQVGWCVLRLQQDGNDLAICEPNFDTMSATSYLTVEFANLSRHFAMAVGAMSKAVTSRPRQASSSASSP